VRVATRRQPVALDGSLTGLRFLVCALCATEWHVVRIKCASCASTESIAYFEIEGADGLVKAEIQTNAGTYSKIIFAKKHADPEVFADDQPRSRSTCWSVRRAGGGPRLTRFCSPALANRCPLT